MAGFHPEENSYLTAQGLDNALEDAALGTMVANYTEDVKEGIAAFHEKRAPKFKGK